ncbi:mucin-like protein [Mercenaria mercenaria]|uniref:mucin-like protein n=1 Tax=Mercenaria mercenaria TaxID=6596 RepID=UPI00234FAD51|nr:mucin-like protein [Mercenaria mercenaria]
MNDADCRERLYGDKLNMAKPALPTFTTPIPANGAPHPPTGYGAGFTRPFTNRDNPVYGQYGPWTEWSQCSRTCDEGEQFRTRRCDSPLPANGGAECADNHVDSRVCNLEPCAIDGGFTEWTEWSACVAFASNYCSGSSERTRTCTNPVTMYGGLACEGSTSEMKRCSVVC